jgi:S-DNA-T family DNA segregation ATPase FtsK/SpoIIIE
MFENRNLKLDLCALALLVGVIFLGLALVTYHPADPTPELPAPLSTFFRPDTLVHPQNARFANACGRWGALAADLLLTSLGVGAYYLVVSAGVLDMALLRRRHVDAPILRSAGWVASLIGLTTMVAMLVPTLSPGPVIGAGGYLGALGRGLLEMHFASAGALILAGSFMVGGLFLCTDYALFRLVKYALGFSYGTLTKTRAPSSGQRARRKDDIDLDPGLSDESEHAAAEAERKALSVRIRGKRGADDLTAAAPPVEPAVKPKPKSEKPVIEQVEEDENDEEEVEAEADEAAGEAGEEEAQSSEAKKHTPGPHFRAKKPRDKDERQEVISQLDEASRSDEPVEYELPALDLLLESDDVPYEAQEKEVRRKAKILEKTFEEFGFKVKVVEIETGPVIAQFEVQLEAGLRLSKITGLADDLAIALRVPSVRIVAPIPGKNTVGIEVPNETRQVVRLREVMEEANGKTKKMRIPLFLGKDVSGSALVVDLSTLPHLLIAGRTGTGKSVCLNAIISSILMTRRPDEVRMLMIDPKMVELSGYARLPHLMHPVVTDMRKAEAILAWAVEKMEERYALLAKAGVRHICSYNQLGEQELMERLEPEDDESRQAIPINLPFIVIVADEIADLMMTSGKEVEQHIIRLAQKSRAVGIHLILATQKPTVDVITGLIKSNLPARIAFQVASRTDSRVVLDEMGADKLLGNGDMLFLWPGTSTLLRGQGTYLGDDEINKIVDCVSQGEQNFVKELVNMKVESPDGAGPGKLPKRDDLYESAVDMVVREGRGSVSLLQRGLGIGYGRAARLIDFMAEDGIVGAYAGSQAREVLITLDDWERMQGNEPASAEAASPAKAKRPSKIVPEPEFEEDEESAYDDQTGDIEDEPDENDEASEADDESDEFEAEGDDEGEDLFDEDQYQGRHYKSNSA